MELRLVGLKAREKPKSKFVFTSRQTESDQKSTLVSTPPTALTALPRDQERATITTTPTPSTSYTICFQSNAHIRPPRFDYESNSDSPSAYTLTLSDLESCVIDLRPAQLPAGPALTTLHIRGLRSCILIAPIISGSALASAIYDCLLIIGAQQVC